MFNFREKRRDEHDGSGRKHRCRDFHSNIFYSFNMFLQLYI